MSEYSTRKIGAAEFELLIPLMKDCFGMDVNLAYFQWKYIDNPAGSFIGFIAIENETGEVGSFYCAIPQKLVIDGIEKTVYQTCDIMTHSRHRRRGLFKMLAMEYYDYLRKNHSLFNIAFGGAESTPGFLKFGWKHVFNFRYCFRPAIFCKTAAFNSYPQSHFNESPDLEDLQQLCNNMAEPGKIHSKRNPVHILWRSKNNHFNYRFVFYKPQNQVQGYVLYYINKDKLILFDAVFLTETSRRALVWYLCRLVNKNKYKAIIAYCQENGFTERQLRKSLFISNPFKKGPLSERTPFIFYADESVMEKYASPEKWQITSYDHDAI